MKYNIGDYVRLKSGEVVLLHKYHRDGAFIAQSANGMIIVVEKGGQNPFEILDKFQPIDLDLCSACGDTAGINFEKIEGEKLCKICYDEHMYNQQYAIADQETENELYNWGKM